MGLAAATIGAGVIGGVASVANGVMQSNAAKSAANAQTAANNAAIAEQQREFNVNQANLSPWLSAGRSALSQQMALLGLGSLSPDVLSGAASSAAASPAITPGGLTTAQAQALLQARPDVLAEYQRASSTGDPNSPIYAQEGLTSPEAYANYWYNNLGGSNSYQLPGTGATTTATGAGTTQSAADQQQAAINALQSSPLYTSLYRNGQQAVLANASATGGLRGGNVQSSLANFGADTLAQVYQQQLANLGGISGNGLSTGGTLGTLGSNSANNISSLLSQNGSASAGGILSSTGLLGGGINSGLSSILNGLGQYSTYGGGSSYQTGLPQSTGLGGDTSMNGLF